MCVAAACIAASPGGECATPSGQRACTWHASYDGEISLDELSGIGSFDRFWRSGAREWLCVTCLLRPMPQPTNNAYSSIGRANSQLAGPERCQQAGCGGICYNTFCTLGNARFYRDL